MDAARPMETPDRFPHLWKTAQSASFPTAPTAIIALCVTEKNEDHPPGSLVTEAEDSLHCRTP